MTTIQSLIPKTLAVWVLLLATLLSEEGYSASAKRSLIEPSSCISGGSELLNAVRDYYTNIWCDGQEGCESDSYSAKTYGFPISDWCLSDPVLAKLDIPDGALQNHLADALAFIIEFRNAKPTMTPVDPDPNAYANDWNAHHEHCLDVCSGIQEDNTLNELSEGETFAETATTSSSHSRSKTTTDILLRLIPLKLMALLALMCLALGIRQMVLNSQVESDFCYCWCFRKRNCCSFFCGSSRGGTIAYEGIDPSDVSDHQKSVEFELLQLANDNSMDNMENELMDEDYDDVEVS